MNTQEREKLTHFLQQLSAAQLTQKDGEAESVILAACRAQPDAAYLLVQRSLLLEQALENAQAEITRLRAEQSAARGIGGVGGAGNTGSFLDDNAWGNSRRPVAPPVPAATPYMPAPAAAGAVSAPAAPVAAAPSFFNSGVLGNVATAAAGVVAGSFLFQGIGHLLGNHGGTGFLSGNTDHASQALPTPTPTPTPTENVVVNNYYDTADGRADDTNGANDLDALVPTDDDLDLV